jgi:hypothetical protein
MQKVIALTPNLNFSPYILKNFRFATALSINFKKGLHGLTFLLMCHKFGQVTLINWIGGYCLTKKHFGRTTLPLIHQPNSTHILSSWKIQLHRFSLLRKSQQHTSVPSKNPTSTISHFFKKYSFKCSNNNILFITLHVCLSKNKNNTKWEMFLQSSLSYFCPPPPYQSSPSTQQNGS